MADHLTDILKKLDQIVSEAWSTGRVIDVVGPDGARYWIRFTGDEIKGEYAYDINPEEAMPENKLTRRQEMLQFMQIAKDVPGINMPYLMKAYAHQFEWLDPKMLFPQDEPGRSPEKAMDFPDMLRHFAQMQPAFMKIGGESRGEV